MKKTSKYSRKRAHMAGAGGSYQYNGAEFLNTIQRCRAYTTEVLPGATIGNTQEAADNMRNTVNRALGMLCRGEIPADSENHPFDLLAHAVGVALIRTEESKGDRAAAFAVLTEGSKALASMRDRQERIGKWGATRPEQLALSKAIMAYEEILQESTPAQMHGAAGERMRRLRAGGWTG